MQPTRSKLAGADALNTALDAGRPPRLVLRRPDELTRAAAEAVDRAAAAGVEVRAVSDRQLERLAGSRAPTPELLALVGPEPDAPLAELFAREGAVWLLVQTAYPGNAGFVIRTAEVSGAAGVVIDASFDHAERRDVRRAAMRADRYMPVCYAEGDAALEAARERDRRVIGIEDSGDRAPWESDLTGPALFVVGGERRGIPSGVLSACDEVLRLPMAGFLPSYNLQAAMAMVVGERLRQLALGAPGGR